MSSRASTFRNITVIAFAFLLGTLAPQVSSAQSVSVSPVALSYGIPTGTTPPLTFTQTVTVNLTGSGPVTLSGFGITGTNLADFIVNGNTCTAPQTAPATCQISVQFTSTQPAGTLETATLSIASSTSPTVQVPLSGAFGAIKLFDETNITPTNATFASPYTIATKTVNLTCPASPTATVSGTPDGAGYVLVDNYLTLATGSPLAPVNDVPFSSEFPSGNVCGGPGSSTDFDPVHNSDDNNCVSNYYVDEIYLNGLVPSNPDPDSFANPGNAVLPKPAHGTNAGGVPPFSVSSFVSPSATLQTLFTLSTSGAEAVYDNSTLFLVTNCTAPGIIPGSSTTLNPQNANNPGSLTQTANLDNSPGQNISFTTSDTVAVQSGTGTLSPGIVPIVTDYAIPQQLFSQLVAGTSAAPAVCARLAGELDYTVTPPAPMCKGYLLQCFDPVKGTTSGDNCAQSTARNILFTTQFTSPDEPSGVNFLTAQACQNVVPGGTCAPGTGAGVLMGSDNWLCPPGQTEPCTPPEPPTIGTTTGTSPATYSVANCSLTGLLKGAICPLNVLTSLLGAADSAHIGGASSSNSVYVPASNVPQPTATASIGNNNGWVSMPSTASATFTASPATYPNTGNIPPENGFTPAAPYSLTYGVSPFGQPLPDTTYPVSGDQTNFNTNTTQTAPFCNSTPNAPFMSNTAPGFFSSLPDGMYNLHFFATDCAFTEGLLFNPTGAQLTDPTANWASFPFTTFGIDTQAPTIAPCTAPNASVWYNTNVSVTCTASDQNYVANVSGSGFLPLTNGIQGSSSETTTVSTNVAPNTFNAAAPLAPNDACDLAGNCVNIPAGPYQIDLQPPSVTLTAGSSTVGGTAITVTFTCSDAGSGIPVGGCTISGTPANYTAGVCTPTSGASVTCGGTIPTSIAESGMLTATANDVAGNVTPSSPVAFSVEQAQAIITFGPAPTPTYLGPNFTVSATTTNTDSNALTYSVVSGPCTWVSGATFSSSGAGMCVVKASGAATANFLAASATQNVTIAAATPTVMFGAAPTPTYLGGNFMVSATTTNTDSNALTYSVVSGPCALVSGATFSSSGGGICMVKASGAATANFLAASATQSVTISPAKPTIAFGPPPAPTYPGSNFMVSATTNSNGALTYSYVSGPCTLVNASTGTFSPTGAGSCVTQANTAATTNFIAGSATQTVIITAATPTVSVTPSSLTFGPIKPGTTASAKVTVQNTGNTTVTIKSVTVSENDTDEFSATKCPASLTVGNSCIITVTYHADSDDGNGSTATLVITDNAAGSPQKVSLKGTSTGRR